MAGSSLNERRAKILKLYGESERVICEKERERLTQVSRSTWWRMKQAGKPLPQRLPGTRKARWLLSDILFWINGIH